MSSPERYAVLAPMPAAGPFRRELAIERGAVSRAVVIYTPPAEYTEDPARLLAMARDAEAAARFQSRFALQVVGLETLRNTPSIVETYRAGVTLREVLEVVGRLPAPLAARVVLDVCTALAAIHVFDAGDGEPFVHGALGPERVWISDSGESALCGLGTGHGEGHVGDVLAAVGVLAECLTGERLGERFDAPGVPPAIASVVNRYRSPASAVLGPLALGEAIIASLKSSPATGEDLAAFVDAALPPDRGSRGERQRLIEEALGPEARFGGAAAGSRARPGPKEGPVREPSPEAEEPLEEVAVDQILDHAQHSAKTLPMMRAAGGEAPDVAHASVGDSPQGKPESTPIAPAPDRAGRPMGKLIALGILLGAAGFGTGFALSRMSEASPASAAPAAPSTIPPVSPAEPPRTSTGVPNASPPKPVATSERASAPEPGLLTVEAPDMAEVRLDGKLLGSGRLKREIPAGRHRIEVRLGAAKTGEAFTLEPAGSYDYVVTPVEPAK